MPEGNQESVSNNRTDRHWRPRIGSQEWYCRYAIDFMRPVADHTDEYKEAYIKLEQEVEAADSCFQRGYELYVELSNMTHGRGIG